MQQKGRYKLQLTKEQILKQKNKLVDKGVTFCDNKINTFFHQKHINRYLDIVEWIKENKLPMTETFLNLAYISDVCIRRIILKILKPLELEIIASLCYFFRI